MPHAARAGNSCPAEVTATREEIDAQRASVAAATAVTAAGFTTAYLNYRPV